MTATIPRAEIDAVMEQYGMTWPAPDGDPSAPFVREAVVVLRREAASISGTRLEDVSRRVLMVKMADDLDALADRYEREAA